MQPINASLLLNAVQSGRYRKVLAFGLGLAVCVPAGAQAQFYARGWGSYGGPYGYYGGRPYADYDEDDFGPGPGYERREIIAYDGSK